MSEPFPPRASPVLPGPPWDSLGLAGSFSFSFSLFLFLFLFVPDRATLHLHILDIIDSVDSHQCVAQPFSTVVKKSVLRAGQRNTATMVAERC